MALEPPAPGILFRRRAEDGDEIVDGIAAAGGRVLLELLQNEFQRHDGFGARDAGLAETGAEQRAGQGPLVFGHLFERQALAGHRREKPVFALLVGERIGRQFLLVGAERAEEFIGGGDHVGRGFVRAQQRGREDKQGEDETTWGGAHG